ncbi:MAG: hypothetical protein Q8M09_13615 [Pseudomonadota bacterium]|nr:hypothetical protein [Pseudomonadota bacterium]MDP1905265.1 hypothetical protein [Pseudomonadota bacterium]MDP2352551.1 hypothetical protein [Pseudomonadota bacterium]
MRQHPFHLPIALALGLAVAGSALAAPPAGRLLASQCAQCHGSNGNGPGFDKLAGMSAREMSNELLEMKYRVLPKDIMDRQAHGYTDAQIQLIANYFAGQTAGSGTGGGTSTGTGGGGSVDSGKSEKKEREEKKQKEKKSSKSSREHRD